VRERGCPIVLFIDDAHHLNDATLTDLRRLTDVVEEGGVTLSIVLTGQPKLRENVRLASAKETRLHTDVFTLNGIAGNERAFLAWLLHDCSGGTIEPHAVLTAEAVNVLTSKLRTPLRMQWHLTQALEAGYRASVSPVPVDLLETAFMTPL
jgi:type II secretory pathway predicted ATPase ExeA